MAQRSEHPPEHSPEPEPEPKPSRLAKRYRRLSLQARVWESERLVDEDLTDVPWDAEACCPWCRPESGEEPPPKP